MKLSISNRLLMVCNLLDPVDTLADVGCDHAFISIYLLKNGIIKRSIASDINEGPIKKAIINIEKYGFADKITTRISDGVLNYQPGEVDGIIVAGMGGMLMKNILINGKDVFMKAKEWILQPQSDPDEVRNTVYEFGYEIVDEKALVEDGKFYQAFKCIKSERPKTINTIEAFYGPILLSKKDATLKEYLDIRLEKNKRVRKQILNNGEKTVSESIELIDKEEKRILSAMEYFVN